jgi:transcriptional regulator with XRE-family HTH domain
MPVMSAGAQPMAPRIKTYVRPLRRRWALTQRELAFLIGVKNGAAVSRIERLKRSPSLPVTFACALVFGTAPPELFPALISKIHDDVLRRVSELYEELQGNPSKETRIKLDFLEGVLVRLEGKGTANDA